LRDDGFELLEGLLERQLFDGRLGGFFFGHARMLLHGAANAEHALLSSRGEGPSARHAAVTLQ
jgi:hypothetical protein